MKFSIVTPSFNQAEYLLTCLRSVSGQTYRETEHLVIDGGSTDGTVEILQKFQSQDRRLKFVSERDRGQAEAVNKGFVAATGDIIAWINSDDYYFSPGVFEVIAHCFSEWPDVDFIYGGMVWVDGSDHPLTVRLPPKFNWQRLANIAYIGNTNSFFRRSVIERHHIDADLHYVLDHEFVLRATRDFNARPLSQLVACFRVHPAAKTQTLTEVHKNQERRRRNAKLGLSYPPSALQLGWWRLQYRMDRLKAELRYLPHLRREPPYSIFLGA